ncbi:phage head spike fiber domain-containing protein [Burkholderia anthina]|uniref:phage head spike fiber domain-containing protein n=1 Tax=Burkholderia anthina TaxID=179879 RepID=UPI00158A37D0|nr:hypothetical protein [Burkholderia anthina]
MRLTQKLQRYLNRVFKKDPVPALALSITYSGTDLTWQVQDGFLTTAVVGGPGQSLSIDLSQYTIAQLGTYLLSQSGYSLSYLAPPATLGSLSALSLLDGSGDIAQPGGSSLYVYTDSAYAFLDAAASELELAKQQIESLPGEMSTSSADTIWLDMLGSYYNVPRMPNEADATYGPRIIATVLRPQSNNVAIEMAIETYTGQLATVTDVVLPGVTGAQFNSVHNHDGSIEYNAQNTPVYGLFDVTYGYDIENGADLTSFRQVVVQLINLLRAAGTHMRSIALTGSALTDALTSPPTDGGNLAFSVGMSPTDTLTTPSDGSDLTFTSALTLGSDALTAPSDSSGLSAEIDCFKYTFGGTRTYGGAFSYSGNTLSISPAPSVDWDFRSGALDGSLTFSRASVGTYFDASCTLQTAPSGVPRFDHDPSSALPLGLLMEEARTNLFAYSCDFTSAQWYKQRISLTTAAAIAPDGTLTAQKMSETANTDGGGHYFDGYTGTTVDTTQPYTRSIFVKAAERSFVAFFVYCRNNTGTYARFIFDTSSGNFSGMGVTNGTQTYSAVQLPGGWWRVSQTTTFTTADTDLICRTMTALNASTYNYNGDGTSGLYVWGAQLEAGSFPTSLILTTGASLTRNPDLLTTKSFPWFNANAGTMACEGTFISTLSAAGALAAIDDGSNNGLMLIKPSGAASISGYCGNGVASSGAAISSGTSFRAALAYTSIGFFLTAIGSASIYRNDWQGNQQLYPTPRTNLLKYSEDFTQGNWGKSNITLTPNVIMAPDGRMIGAKLTENTATSEHYSDQSGVAVDTTKLWTRTLWVQGGERTKIVLKVFCQNNTSSYCSVLFDTASGTFSGKATSNGTLTYTATPAPNGWWKLTFTTQFTTADTAFIVRTQIANATGGTLYAGDGTSGLYVQFQQLEAGGTGGSYIATLNGSATVTDYTLNGSTVSFSSAPVPGSALTWSGTGVDATTGTGITATNQSFGTGDGATTAFTLSAPSLLNACAASGQGGVSIPNPTPITAAEFSLGSACSGLFPMSGWIRRFTYVGSTFPPPLLQPLTA